jgi:metal-dependent amidase/aminoacylase/carboxypeptidase family protein
MARNAKRTKRNHHGLFCAYEHAGVFAASINEPEATAILANGLGRAGIGRHDQMLPSVGSEDFGQFGLSGAKAAMLVLGSGPDWPRSILPNTTSATN